ncbi:hypothetical protein FRC05_007121, partial [Tulasnella sp. 425]
NSISVAELWPNDQNKDIEDLKNPIDLSNWLDQFKTYTDETKWFEWDRLKAEARIGSGSAPGSFCNIFTK